jgi:hypothetical protein
VYGPNLMNIRWSAAEQALRRFELACIEPLQFAARKRRRLALFGIESLEHAPCAKVDWMPWTQFCVPDCAGFIVAERCYFAKYVFGNESRGVLWRGIPCVVDLDRYQHFDRYVTCLRRHSKGANLRQIRRARAEGFFCKRIFRPLYQRQRFEIDISKRFRSGLVLATIFRERPMLEFGGGFSSAEIASYLGRPSSDIVPGIALPEPSPPPCPYHWWTDWGVFISEDGADAVGGTPPRERLVGYLFLKRLGSIVRTTALMGHGAYLARGVMKLLFHDVMEWLLAREDPRVQGLRFLQYGALEHGNRGLIDWKQRFGFVPTRYSC